MQVGLKAYLLWESNGKPDGGDFSEQARAELETELRRGMSLQELERRLKTVRRGHRKAAYSWKPAGWSLQGLLLSAAAARCAARM